MRLSDHVRRKQGLKNCRAYSMALVELSTSLLAQNAIRFGFLFGFVAALESYSPLVGFLAPKI